MQSKALSSPSGIPDVTLYQRVLLTLLSWTGFTFEVLMSDSLLPSQLGGGCTLESITPSLTEEELEALEALGFYMEESYQLDASSELGSGTELESLPIQAYASRLKH